MPQIFHLLGVVELDVTGRRNGDPPEEALNFAVGWPVPSEQEQGITASPGNERISRPSKLFQEDMEPCHKLSLRLTMFLGLVEIIMISSCRGLPIAGHGSFELHTRSWACLMMSLYYHL